MKQYSKTVLCLLTLGIAFAAPLAQAQDQEKGGPRRERGPEGARMMNPSERTKRMAERLQLSEEQVKKITEIFEASMKEMQEMRKSSEGDRESARAKMAERRKVEIEKIKALLTEEQAKKFDEMMARGPRGRGPGGPGGPEGKRHD